MSTTHPHDAALTHYRGLQGRLEDGDGYRSRFGAGDLVVITNPLPELHGRTATILLYSEASRTYSVKVLDGPVLPIRVGDLMDAAEFWEREEAHR